MTEISFPWPNNATGDGRTYTDDEWSDFWKELFVRGNQAKGVLRDIGGELEVTGTTSPVSVATGRAMVDGKYYSSDAAVDVTIPTPSAGNDRIDLIVLEKDWSAQTVRIERVAGAEASAGTATPPALTQSDGSIWQIKLAEVLIDDGGSITVTDERSYLWSRLSFLYEIHERDTPSAGHVVVANPSNIAEFSAGGAGSGIDADTVDGVEEADIAGLSLIEEIALGGSPAAAIDFTSIPSGFRALQLVYTLRSTEADTEDFVQIQFNGDTGGSYDYRRVDNGSVIPSQMGVAQIQHRIPAGNSPASVFGSGKAVLDAYAVTDFFKNIIGEVIYKPDGSSISVTQYVGQWRNTAAINRIRLFPSAGPNFHGDSRAKLFGLR